ncbi:MAG: hypothetical protein IH987_20090 [Planctomycetes bacterium]|nr:hypothetical protein [Planctomycetota bacterium]
MKIKRHVYLPNLTAVVILSSAVCFALLAFGQSGDTNVSTAAGPPDYGLSWYTIDGGGAMRSTADGYELSGTIGQPDASGPMISGEYELTGGFWFAQVPGDCIFDGAVNLLDHSTFVDCSAGPNTSPAGDGCACFDLDDDNDVDLDDFGRFQRQFNGS